MTSMPEPKRTYPEKLFKVKDGKREKLQYVGCSSTPYLGHYYTYYKDSEGETMTVVFFADYTIITPDIVK